MYGSMWMQPQRSAKLVTADTGVGRMADKKKNWQEELAETVAQVPAEHTQELRALIMGFIAGVNSAEEKQEAS